MHKLRIAVVCTVFVGSALAILFLAPTEDLGRVIAYVLMVECPALAIIVLGLQAYLEWESSRG